jgi:hypothetical protein
MVIYIVEHKAKYIGKKTQMLSYNLTKRKESTCNDSMKANQVYDPKINLFWLSNKISNSHIVEAALEIYLQLEYGYI